MIFIVLYSLYALVVVINTYMETDGDMDSMACTPHEIYETNDINMFGCVLLCVLWFVINPLHVLWRFLSWLVHVGRK